jgi:hypothetical protein
MGEQTQLPRIRCDPVPTVSIPTESTSCWHIPVSRNGYSIWPGLLDRTTSNIGMLKFVSLEDPVNVRIFQQLDGLHISSEESFRGMV